MKPTRLVVPLVAIALSAASASFAQESPAPPPDKVDMAAMMEKAKKFTQPGKNHELLRRFLGTWDTETRMMMPGNPPPEKGTMTCHWLIDGRWMLCESNGTMMGMPMKTAYIIGYDNFKQSYISAAMNGMDTAMIYSEGDLDPSGKALIMYGTLDEYLTGEHDKMVKSVFRFISDDEMKLEVHDLPIGETNTEVFEIRYRRHKGD